MKPQRLFPALILTVFPLAAATLTHDYQFQNTLADSLGGPSLVSLGGTLDAGEYTFGADQGLSVSNALLNDADYSIYINFEFDSLSGYKKIVDFKNLASDNGLYNLDTDLDYYPYVNGSAGALSPGTFEQVVITRDAATNTVTGYVNGLQQIQFTDSSSDAVFSATNNIINFFQDDTVTGGRESSPGAVSQIEIFDGALTTSEVAALSPSSVPEPVSLYLAGTGLALCLVLRQRGFRRSRRIPS